jgi:hypothetical protein
VRVRKMPYLKSNWSSMPPLEEFGRFAFGEIFTIPEMTLTQEDPTARACYLYVALEHQARVQELDLICAAPTIVVNLMRGKSSTAMSYTYLTTLKGQSSEEYPGLFVFRIDASLLSHVEVWQLQIKFLFPRVGEKSLLVKKISVIVEDQAKRRGELNMKAETGAGRRGVLDRSNSTAIQTFIPSSQQQRQQGYAPPQPPQPFNAESAVMVGLVVVDQVLGVMTKEIQENLQSTCRGMEERLLADLSRLEEKMGRIEEVYDDIAADIRLTSLLSALEGAKIARGMAMAKEEEQRVEGGAQEGVSEEKGEGVESPTGAWGTPGGLTPDMYYGVGVGV